MLKATHCYVTSPPKSVRLIAGASVVMLAFMFKLFFMDADARLEWHVSGGLKIATQITLCGMIVIMAVICSFLALVDSVLFLDTTTRIATRVFRISNLTIYRKRWNSSELQRIDVNQRSVGEDRDAYQTSVGLGFAKGPTIWVRSFPSV